MTKKGSQPTDDEQHTIRHVSRRRLLGLVSGAAFGGIAGCGGDGDGDTPTAEPTATDAPDTTASDATPATTTEPATTTAPDATTATTADTATPTATATDTATPTATPSEWTQLFNGEDIDDWTRKFAGQAPGETHKNTFVVEDDILKVTYDDYDSWDGAFGHLFYDGEFSHYALRVEYRFGDEQVSGGPDWAVRNNGLMLHGQTPQEMDIDQDFAHCIEVQLMGQSGRATANLCTPGTNVVMNGQDPYTNHCTDSSSDNYPADDWVQVTVVVRGSQQFRHYVEDTQVMSYTEPQLDPSEPGIDDDTLIDQGTISVQAETYPTQFRTIELKEIDPDAPIGEGYTPGE